MSRVIIGALLLSPTLAFGQTKPTIKPADYAKWESLQPATLSPNGQWLVYGVNRVNEENELRITTAAAAANDTTVAVAYATGATFSTDSKWLAYTIGVSPAERDRMTRARTPIRNSVGVRNLAAGTSEVTKDITSWSFSRDGKHIAMRRYPAEGKRAAEAIVQNLATGEKLIFGNVTEMAWAEGAPLLALTIESEGTGASNVVQLYDARAGALKSLDASASLYRQLAWRERSTDLAVLRTRVGDRGFRDTAHVLLAWRDLGRRTATADDNGGRQQRTATADGKSVLDSATAGLDVKMRIAEHRRPEWSKDGSVIFIGLRPRLTRSDSSMGPGILAAGGSSNSGSSNSGSSTTGISNSGMANTGGTRSDSGRTASADPPSDVQIWHAKDVRVQQEQRQQEQRDLQATLVAAWHPGENRVVQIGSDLQESVTILEGSKHAIESDTKPYAFGAKFGRAYRDVYVVDVKTGARKKALEKVRYTPGRSATGRKLLWFDGKNYLVYDVVTGATVNLSAKTNGQFFDADYDTPTDMMPSHGLAGWTRDDAGVIVYDEFDLWWLAPDGSGGRKITDGWRDSTVYRYTALPTGDRTPGIDIARPIFLSASGARSKKSGYAILRPGRLDRVVFEDARVRQLSRADSTDVFAFVREKYDDSPDLFVGSDLKTAVQRSKTNPQQASFAWGRTELVNFKSARGKDLQGILMYPANYDASKKYPMIVYTYELLSQGVHNYVVPSERSYYNTNVWTANGYFVLQPDIVFRAREPGMSTLDAVEPAIRSIAARGLIDSTKVGHIGHSWGGYEAAFLPTRSRMFAASVAGAAITNMLSFMGELHWGPGIPELTHWETGQARMEVPFWEDMDAYIRNSPVAKVHELRSPVLLMTGDNDGTVYWHQAVEYYNYARRAGREDVVMLVYPTEDHGLRKKENQIDYHRRINEWFGHFLKGEPAPKWMTDGMSWLDRKAALDSAATRRP